MNETIDIDDLVATISAGIYGDDRMSKEERNDAFSALAALLAEVERLRTHRELCTANLLKGYETGKAEERAAVVAWLRDVAETMNHNGDKCCGRVEDLAAAIERGEHRREE